MKTGKVLKYEEVQEWTEAVVLSRKEYDAMVRSIESAHDLQAYWYSRARMADSQVKQAREILADKERQITALQNELQAVKEG